MRWGLLGQGIAVAVLLVVAAEHGVADEGAESAKADDRTGQDFGLTVTDVSGGVHQLAKRGGQRALVVAFLSTECPVANAYIPTLNGLHAEWQKLDGEVVFYGVISDRSVTRAAAATHSEKFKVRFPMLFDASGELAAWLKPSHTPEVFVLDASGKIAYRGRIDNTFADLGKRRLKATKHDLVDAVTAVVSGKPVAVAKTKPVGCFIETPSSKDSREAVTYNRDIAPIVHAHCMSCHRTGEVSPFPLTDFANVSKRARQVARVTTSRFMPPWKPERNFGHFLGERRLTDFQISLLSAWAKSGAPEGDAADLPAAPKFIDGWQLGEPDLIVEMPEAFEIPADGPDLFRNFVIPLNLTKDKYCVAAEFRPGSRRVVHHAIFYLDSRGAARRRDKLDPALGYGTFGGPGILPTGSVGGWSPGNTPRVLPGGMARFVKKGSDLVLQVHYHPTGKRETDKSVIGLHFVDAPKNVIGPIIVTNFNIAIPAGEKRHRVTGTYTLTDDVTMWGATPHMHLLGRDMKATALLPDGTVKPLIRIKDWNFYWQDQYLFDAPVKLPKGTRINVEAHYDNSDDNPFNPNSPPETVNYGDETTDEMFFCFFMVATKSPSDLRPLVGDNLRYVVRQGFGRFLRRAVRPRK